MTELGVNPADVPLESIRNQEHAIEESLAESFLARNLFHNNHLEAALGVWQDHEYQEYVKRLEREFLNDKREKNMGDRFAMAISEKYLGKIHVVKLGGTANADPNGDVDGLRQEYRELVSWMQHPKQENIADRYLLLATLL